MGVSGEPSPTMHPILCLIVLISAAAGAPRDKAKNTEIEHLINIQDPDGSLILIQMDQDDKRTVDEDLLDASFSPSGTNLEENVEDIKVPLPVDSLEHDKMEDQDNHYMDSMDSRENHGEENMDLLKSMEDTAKDSIDLLENMEEHAEESEELLEYVNMEENAEESMDLLEHGNMEENAEESMDLLEQGNMEENAEESMDLLEHGNMQKNAEESMELLEHGNMEENAEESSTNRPRDGLSDIIDDIYEDTNLSKKHKKSKITKNGNKSSKKPGKKPGRKPGKKNRPRKKHGKKPGNKLDCTCGIKNNQRIVNGQAAAEFSWPWMARLTIKYSSGTYQCGGSLIADQWVLTATHCTEEVDGELPSIQVHLGDHDKRSNKKDTNDIVVPVSKILNHMDYGSASNGAPLNDISLLKLRKKVDMRTFTPVCLPREGSQYEGKKTWVYGWGTTDEGGSTSKILQETQVEITGNEACSEEGYGESITPQQICAYTEGTDACQGDSGGPLSYDNNCKHEQVGIVSYGYGCARKNYSGVYTRVTQYLDWIQEQTEKHGGARYCQK